MSQQNPSERPSERPQIVLLGASNLALSLPWILTILERGFSDPLDILMSCGHGRSYGNRSRVLVRSLTGIRDCGLWEHLSSQPGQRQVLVTDIGNDIMYGVTPQSIADWVSDCIDRCQPADGQLLITQLPLDSLERLSSWKFRLIKAVLFPRHQVSWPTVQTRIQQLAQHLKEIATAAGGQLITPKLEWYGIDPIHIRRSQRTEAWDHIFSHWTTWTRPQNTRSPSVWKCLQSWRLRPQQRQILGRTQCASQPVIDRRDQRLFMF
jgi:hypothetical protein